MSRRTIVHAERVIETHANRDANGTWTTAHYVPQRKDKPDRAPYGLFSTDGDTPRFITRLSGRFGRAMRRAAREGKFYPRAFMAYYTERQDSQNGGWVMKPEGEHYYIGEARAHMLGQSEARRAVTAPRSVDWDKPGFIETVREHMAEQGL